MIRYFKGANDRNFPLLEKHECDSDQVSASKTIKKTFPFTTNELSYTLNYDFEGLFTLRVLFLYFYVQL